MIFNQNRIFSSQHKLIKEYKELLFYVNQTGGNVWAEYIVEFHPKEQSEIKAKLIDKSEKYKNYYECFEQGITQSISSTLSKLNNRQIGLSGFDMTITNLSYHPVDSKPVAYKILFEEMMNRILNSNYFQMQIDETTDKSPFYNIRTLKYDELKEPYLLSETHHNIVSPKIFTNTIVLNERVEILINDIEHNINRWKVTLSPKRNSKKIIYNLGIELRDKYHQERKYKTFGTFYNITEQISKIREELAHRRFNLSGLDILIEPLYHNELEPSVKSNIDQLKWAVLNVLLNKNLTETRKENL